MRRIAASIKYIHHQIRNGIAIAGFLAIYEIGAARKCAWGQAAVVRNGALRCLLGAEVRPAMDS